MKYCAKCGCSNEETAKFCENCGAPLTEASNPRSDDLAPQGAPIQTMPESGTSAISVVKKLFSSTLFLVIAALLAVSVVFGIISAIEPSYTFSVTAFAKTAMENFGTDFSELEKVLPVDTVLNVLQTQSVASAIVSSLPAILFCAALFMMYAAARAQREDSLSTAGLTVIKVLAVLSLIGVSFVAVAIVALFAVAIALMAQTEIPALIALFVVLLIFIAAAFALAIAYYAKAIKTVGVIRGAAKFNVANSRISSYVAVLLIISGVLRALGSIYPLGAQTVAGLAKGAAFILLGNFLFRYRDAMQALEARRPVV